MNTQQKSSSVSIAEYRELMKDQVSSDKQILGRLQYLDALCKNIIKVELKKYLDICSH